MGKALGNMKNINEANLGDLSGGEKVQRGIMGGLGGGLQGFNKQQQPQPGYDFSQVGKKSPFYGGY